MKLGHFHASPRQLRALCLTVWLCFLWLLPVALSAAANPGESGHACCRRSKHSCCKKSGKGESLTSRSCGMSCPGLEKFQISVPPAIAPETSVSIACAVRHAQPAPPAQPEPQSSLTVTRYQRPPPAA